MLKFIVSIAMTAAVCGAIAQDTAGKGQAEDAASLMKRVGEEAATYKTAKGTLVLRGEKPGDHMDISFSVMKPNFLTMITEEFELHNAGADTVMYSPKEK